MTESRFVFRFNCVRFKMINAAQATIIAIIIIDRDIRGLAVV
ncbi:MAG TPA: hypothetical protein PLT64_08610 [Syntrophales bacterium]|nr:hypothetical protein [Syntrophales bacterium]HOL59905.1 hypothetical protein [Syntrophales bacterium]HPO36052.1 hypothetical protein [Syntrophales bacterium]